MMRVIARGMVCSSCGFRLSLSFASRLVLRSFVMHKCILVVHLVCDVLVVKGFRDLHIPCVVFSSMVHDRLAKDLVATLTIVRLMSILRHRIHNALIGVTGSMLTVASVAGLLDVLRSVVVFLRTVHGLRKVVTIIGCFGRGLGCSEGSDNEGKSVHSIYLIQFKLL